MSIINEVIPERKTLILRDLKRGDIFKFEGASTIHMVTSGENAAIRTVDLARGRECALETCGNERVFLFDKVMIGNIS